MLTVVIPYFQRFPGLLRRCVVSILSQSCTWPVRVIVTDDSSPIPAISEIADLLTTSQVEILVQKNAGPGAARNHSLDRVHDDSEFIGLMDSDDWWEPGFLAVAEAAFADSQVDLFFCDSRRFGQSETRFQWEADPTANLYGKDHLCVEPDIALHEFKDDFFDFMIKRSSILGTSSMVYRRRSTHNLRFDTTLYNGQDRLFKLHLAQRARRVRFSTLPLSSEGEGINIFDSVQWGTAKSMRLASSYIHLGKKIRNDLSLSTNQRHFVDSQIRKARREFVGNAIHMAAHGQKMDRSLAWRTIIGDPAVIGLAPVELCRTLLRKTAGK